MTKVVETLIETEVHLPGLTYGVRLWLEGTQHDPNAIREMVVRRLHALSAIGVAPPTTQVAAEELAGQFSAICNAVQVKDLNARVSTLVYPDWP